MSRDPDRDELNDRENAKADHAADMADIARDERNADAEEERIKAGADGDDAIAEAFTDAELAQQDPMENELARQIAEADDIPADKVLEANGFATIRERVLSIVTPAIEIPVAAIDAAIGFAQRSKAQHELSGSPAEVLDAIDGDIVLMQAVRHFARELHTARERMVARQRLRAPAPPGARLN